ncbi:E3 ubiquitin-protein ligase Mdm2-like [Hypomesus transpacificus]|uniref:E3 ubiquitin-protein ligase Mdm2-like n=1 Tax=Hypomesus transpacificus TaxID=137520 RepID=UPI001F07A927|nr:E3 ubiquitin-protein ligase Mdm2-like [Hypomesus transpacificus]
MSPQVIFYLGQYIFQKKLYDQKQQHIVNLVGDPLGAVLGIDTFSVKEPLRFLSRLSQNLVPVLNPGGESTGHWRGRGPGSAKEEEEEGCVHGTTADLPASLLDPCFMCQSRPKNGCIVHGATIHLISCYRCARKLQRGNKQCPVCREPMEAVLLLIVS